AAANFRAIARQVERAFDPGVALSHDGSCSVSERLAKFSGDRALSALAPELVRPGHRFAVCLEVRNLGRQPLDCIRIVVEDRSLERHCEPARLALMILGQTVLGDPTVHPVVNALLVAPRTLLAVVADQNRLTHGDAIGDAMCASKSSLAPTVSLSRPLEPFVQFAR